MSSRSILVDTSTSMIIVDPNEFPINLGHTTKEDAPVTAFPVLAYKANNMMPTALGYRSHFGNNKRIGWDGMPLPHAAGTKLQEAFTYQNATMHSFLIELCDDGLYVTSISEGSGITKLREKAISTGTLNNYRYLWTFCVIKNRIYLYHQADASFYAIVDFASYMAAGGANPIAGSTVVQHFGKSNFYIIKITPNFINMAGQIGLFRADNRLGFWDSDGAVSWSSSLYVQDFTPSTSTFAGVTKFSDVYGTIVSVKGYGDGFIIYATKSIVVVVPISGSPEKWRGEAIMSDVGVLFDTQIAAGQPDTTHYAITQNGLIVIENGVPKYMATEVLDYFLKTNAYCALKMVDGRYLFIRGTNEFVDSKYENFGVDLTDANGNKYVFQKPTTTPIEDTEDWLAEEGAGRGQIGQDAFGNAQPIGGVIQPAPTQSTIPCYKGKLWEFPNSSYPVEVATTAAGVMDLYSSAFWGGVVSISPIDSTKMTWLPANFATATIAHELMDEIWNAFYERMNESLTSLGELLVQEQTLLGEIDAWVAEPETITKYEYEIPQLYNLKYALNYDGHEVLRLTGYRSTAASSRFRYWPANEVKMKADECGTKIFFDNQYYFDVESEVTAELMTGRGYSFGAWANGKTYNIRRKDRTKPNDFEVLKSKTVPPSAAHWIVGMKTYWEVCLAKDDLSTVSGSNNYYETVAVPRGNMIPWVDSEDMTPGGDFNAYIGELYFEPSTPGDTYVRGKVRSSGTMYFSAGDSDYISIIQDSSDILDLYNTLVGGEPATVVVANIAESNALADGVIYIYPESDTTTYFTGGDTTNGWEGYPYSNTDSSPTPLGQAEEAARYAAMGTSKAEWASKYGQYITEVTMKKGPTIIDPLHRTQDIIDLEISGYGYIPGGGFSFRKTHNRYQEDCGLPVYGSFTSTKPLPPVTIPELTANPDLTPDYDWQYPDTIPLPDIWVMMQKGTNMPYYPVMADAVVYDLQLTKWGRYNNPHTDIFSLLPMNRVDSTIRSVGDTGLLAGEAIGPGNTRYLTAEQPNSSITYGRVGLYRKGFTVGSSVEVKFASDSTGTLLIEASLDGLEIDKNLTEAISFVGARQVIFPFTRPAQWFNIVVTGEFDLSYIEMHAESRGRR